MTEQFFFKNKAFYGSQIILCTEPGKIIHSCMMMLNYANVSHLPSLLPNRKGDLKPLTFWHTPVRKIVLTLNPYQM